MRKLIMHSFLRPCLGRALRLRACIHRGPNRPQGGGHRRFDHKIVDPIIHDISTADYAVSVRGIDGATSAEMQPFADAYAAGVAGGRPDVVVINLGTGDSWKGVEPLDHGSAALGHVREVS